MSCQIVHFMTINVQIISPSKTPGKASIFWLETSQKMLAFPGDMHGDIIRTLIVIKCTI